MSRLIVKNLPAYADDAQLRKHFTQSSALKPGQPSTAVSLNLTDVRLARRPDGKSRRFAFLGYKTNEEAIAAKKYFDRSYIGGSRISVEIVDSTKLHEPNKKRARTSNQGDHPQKPVNASSNERANTIDTQSSTINKSSKVKDDFMEAFAHRNKGPSWLDSDAGVATASELAPNQSAPRAAPSDGELSENPDEDADNADPTPMSDLDWMRARMKKNLDDEPPAEKAFYQDDLDNEAKKEKATKRKEDAGRDFNWGMLYMNSDAVLSSVADRLKISKADVLNPEAPNASVRLALAETKVIEETKSFFEQQGVSLESFKSRVKSDTIILVKNIPYGTTADTLRDMFSPFGDLSRILLPPSGTIGVVEFVHAIDASKAFKAVAYRRIKDSIIYLERGPEGMFSQAPSGKLSGSKHLSVASAVEPVSVVDPVVDDSEIPPGATLFVKNLAFATTGETLDSAFRSLPGFAFARIQTKPDPKRPGARLSMGFGFVGFRSVESAQKALAGMQGAVVDGHALQVKFAKRGEVDHQGGAVASIGASKTTKMIVKNLPFEATKKDVRELFSAYGQLKSVRVPRKFNSQTRGFAFLDFISRREAENAFTALHHTHLLGRHLVLQWAEDGAADIEQLRKATKTGWGDGTNIPGRKRKIDMLLDGIDGEVED
ncbi:hypothetical protein RSAG8_00477, partial [Rhizoctonia solani AG-8 WAC10335]